MLSSSQSLSCVITTCQQVKILWVRVVGEDNGKALKKAEAARAQAERGDAERRLRIELERQRAIEKAGGEGAERLRREKEEIAAVLEHVEAERKRLDK
jgi:hypothetical protein